MQQRLLLLRPAPRLQVAVVELRGNTFVGRIFFGDPATGQVAWDCDCRPSDACWLALKVGRRRGAAGCSCHENPVAALCAPAALLHLQWGLPAAAPAGLPSRGRVLSWLARASCHSSLSHGRDFA